MILLAAIFFLTSTLLRVPAQHGVQNKSQLHTTSTLRSVHVIFRHGRRTPFKVFLDDPNNKLWAGYGAGQLTKEGKQDGYALGKWFRQRYNEFISHSANNHEVLIESTNTDRTLESAQLFATALFPPNPDEVWNDNVGTLWQPYSVHPLKFNDYLVGGLDCPRSVQLGGLLTHTPEERRVMMTYHNLTELLSKRLEEPASFGSAFDIIMIEKANNLKYPDWITVDDIAQLRKLQDYNAQKTIKTTDIIRLQCGDFIWKIIYEMLNTAKKNISDLKVHAFSAHDVNLMCLMGALDVYNLIWPPFSSALILELHVDDYNDYYVKVLYRNESMHDPYILSNPYCSEMCSLEDLFNLTMPYFVKDMRKECTAMTPLEMKKKQEELNEMFP